MILALNQPDQAVVARALKNTEWVVAPSLYLYEIPNAMWKYYRSKLLAYDLLKSRVDICTELIDEFVSASAIYEDAFDLACRVNHTVYDAAYLVTCLNKDAELLSFDKRMIGEAKKLNIKCY